MRQPGWTVHFARLALASAVLTAVLLAGVVIWPDWSEWPTAVRAERLLALIAAASVVYVGALLATGLRLRDLRGS